MGGRTRRRTGAAWLAALGLLAIGVAGPAGADPCQVDLGASRQVIDGSGGSSAWSGALDDNQYDPGHWAEVAKAAGMKWMCLTARHHEGFCLFDSPHPNAFTSVQTLKRNLVMEYTQAVRKAGLKVILYYSPLGW